jgi:hypothetical protein
MAAIEENYALNTDNTSSDFFDFFDQCDTQSDSSLASAQGVFVINSNMDDSDFLARGAKKNNRADRSRFRAVAIERKESLRFVIADADLQALGRLLDARVTELLKGIENAITNAILPRIQE